MLALAGAILAQEGFIPTAVKNERKAKLKELADQLLKTKDTHERVRLRDEMLALDTLMGTNGFAVEPFVYVYQTALRKAVETGQDDINARLQAVMGLSAIDSPDSPKELMSMMNDPADAVRLRILKAVYDNAIIRAWEQVVPMLNDPNIEIKIWAARALGKLKQGAEGKATGPMIALLVKSSRELRETDLAQTERRAELNMLIEVLGRSLEQLTGKEWKPGTETAQLGDAIEVYTRWWNQQHTPMLKDPRLMTRRDALQAIAKTGDRSVASELIDFMGQEQKRLVDAPEADKRQHLGLLLMANDTLMQISGIDSPLSTTSSPEDVAGAIKRWATWWQGELKKMNP